MTEQNEIPKLPRFLPKNPLLQGLPPYLKDPANYEKVRKAIYYAGVSKCDHAEVYEWAGCKKCQARQWKRKEMMQRLGFQNGKQYLMWQRIHEKIALKDPLPKYNT